MTSTGRMDEARRRRQLNSPTKPTTATSKITPHDQVICIWRSSTNLSHPPTSCIPNPKSKTIQASVIHERMGAKRKDLKRVLEATRKCCKYFGVGRCIQGSIAK